MKLSNISCTFTTLSICFLVGLMGYGSGRKETSFIAVVYNSHASCGAILTHELKILGRIRLLHRLHTRSSLVLGIITWPDWSIEGRYARAWRPVAAHRDETTFSRSHALSIAPSNTRNSPIIPQAFWYSRRTWTPNVKPCQMQATAAPRCTRSQEYHHRCSEPHSISSFVFGTPSGWKRPLFGK